MWFPASCDESSPKVSYETAVFLPIMLHFGYEVKQPTMPLLNKFAPLITISSVPYFWE